MEIRCKDWNMWDFFNVIRWQHASLSNTWSVSQVHESITNTHFPVGRRVIATQQHVEQTEYSSIFLSIESISGDTWGVLHFTASKLAGKTPVHRDMGA